MGAAASGVSTQMQAEHDPNANFPWWVRFLAKGVGIVGGFLAVFFGGLGLLSLSATCIIAVLLQMVFGFLIIALEAPFCCMFVDFIEKLAQFSESRKHWHKAVLYGARASTVNIFTIGYSGWLLVLVATSIFLMGIAPIILCFELNTFLGSGMIFACGTIYGFMALGRKADRGTMMAAGDPAWSPQVNQPSVS